MTKGKFFIQIYKNQQQTYVLIDGYIAQKDGYWFGIHKWQENKIWIITDLATGWKIKDGCKTLKESESSLHECTAVLNSFIERHTDLYKKAREQCEKAYFDHPKQEEVVNLYWKVFGRA